MPQPADKRRHHYVPVTYLNGFADVAGQVVAYPKDEPTRAFRSRPDRIAFERYYYSQVAPDGRPDHNILEDLFSAVESAWPALVEDLGAGRPLGERAGDLFEFVALLSVRVPAMRDAVELFNAQAVRHALHTLEAQGALPPAPAGVSLDRLMVSIDPNRSLQAMPILLDRMAALINRLGFEVLHNATDIDFITSDNPVVHFDPHQPAERRRPYDTPPGRAAELLLPLNRRLMLRGRTGLPILKTGDKIGRVDLDDPAIVTTLNECIARFGYRFVFAAQPGLETTLAPFAESAPVGDFQSLPLAAGGPPPLRFKFGPRPQKPRWEAGPAG